MMRMTYWKCEQCYGTGKVIRACQALECEDCDGTGNALIDGATERHKRQLAEIEKQKAVAAWQ